MSFLDNLENSLKTLETREERDPNESARRENERRQTLAAAPWAEQLKESEYTKSLFEKAAVAGHRIRAKIYIAWVGTTLRLEARGRILELQPSASGIIAQYVNRAGEEVQSPVDLSGDPDALLNQWLEGEKPPARPASPEEMEPEA
ncbi:MAG TPA: hypothetical protein VH351_16500 [Bryobacteraceae bacterium]|jgi:hypothetical protein|nr:hypothetical protein [Bryobacteraceae bacterium]